MLMITRVANAIQLTSGRNIRPLHRTRAANQPVMPQHCREPGKQPNLDQAKELGAMQSFILHVRCIFGQCVAPATNSYRSAAMREITPTAERVLTCFHRPNMLRNMSHLRRVPTFHSQLNRPCKQPALGTAIARRTSMAASTCKRFVFSRSQGEEDAKDHEGNERRGGH